MSDVRETKTCPDCAEEVLAAANKCRFCGYRFDGRSRSQAGSQGTGNGLMDLLRPTPRPIDLPELLDTWGISMPPGEVADASLLLASLDGAPGFVLLSATRFRFLVSARGRKPPEVRVDRGVHTLEGVALRRRRLRRPLLVLRWPGTELTLEPDPQHAQELHDRLAAYVDPA